MADNPLTLLQALQSGLYQPQETSAGLGAQAIAAAAPALYNPFQSSGENFGYTIGAGLLAGLLGGYARKQASDENLALMPVMNQLMTAEPGQRAAIAAGEPRLSPLVQALAFEDYSSKRKAQDAIDQYKLKVQYEPQVAAATMQATDPLKLNQLTREKLAEAALSQGIAPVAGQEVPFSELGLKTPIELEVDKAKSLNEIELQQAGDLDRQKFKIEADNLGYNPKLAEAESNLLEKAAGRDETKEYSGAVPILRTMEKVITTPSRAADLAFVYGLPKLLDPSVVKEGEQRMLMQSIPGLEQWQAEIESVFSGKGKLSLPAREAILAIARDKVASLGEQYNAAMLPYQSQIMNRGLSEERALPFAPFAPTMTEDGKFIIDPITKTLTPVK